MATQSLTHGRLLGLQQQIFKSYQAEVRHVLGATPQAILRYKRQFDADFRISSLFAKRITSRLVSKQALVDAVRDAEVTFIADFHTFGQAQRTALRLMRETMRPGPELLIGLELVPSRCQKALDDYQAGRMTLADFHQAIRYDVDWGFPWANYAPIFEWAREYGARLIGLNRARQTSGRPITLDDRDRWSADIITSVFAETRKGGKQARMLVLYGELHVASPHLPAALVRATRARFGAPLRWLTVHQNHDLLYWKLAQKGREQDTDVVRLKPNVYCVISSTPWAKLQSLVNWAESGSLISGTAGTDTSSDSLSLMRSYGLAVAEFLNLPPPSFDSLNVRSIMDADFIDELTRRHAFGRFESELIRAHVLAGQRIYIPEMDIAYLAAPSPNGAAELAAIHLYHQHTRFQSLFDGTMESFYRHVLEAAFGFLGSLIINPRRKCDLLEDHKRRLRALARPAKGSDATRPHARAVRIRAIFPQEIRARRLAIACLNAEKRIMRTGRFHLRPRGDGASASNAEMIATSFAARFVGQILGKRIYQALVDDSITGASVTRCCLGSSDSAGGSESFQCYLALLRAVRGSKLTSSKTQAL